MTTNIYIYIIINNFSLVLVFGLQTDCHYINCVNDMIVYYTPDINPTSISVDYIGSVYSPT